jgi:hypothetical protein
LEEFLWAFSVVSSR